MHVQGCISLILNSGQTYVSYVYVQVYVHTGSANVVIVLCYSTSSVRSPASYEALKGFNLLQLPSHKTLQAYTGAFVDDPGNIYY